MTIKIYDISVLARSRAQRDDDNPLILQTSKNIFWLIDVDKTVKNIDKELSTLGYGNPENFHDGMSYAEYLLRLRAYLQTLI